MKNNISTIINDHCKSEKRKTPITSHSSASCCQFPTSIAASDPCRVMLSGSATPSCPTISFVCPTIKFVGKEKANSMNLKTRLDP